MVSKLEPFLFTGTRTTCSFERGRVCSGGLDKGELDEYVKVERLSEIAEARLIGIVTIKKDGHVTLNEVSHPEAQCWFYFDCIGNAGATFNIVTDGDKWLPINRRSGKITTNLKPKKSVDLKYLSEFDRELLLHAINTYVARF